jgi:hypothetical protein
VASDRFAAALRPCSALAAIAGGDVAEEGRRIVCDVDRDDILPSSQVFAHLFHPSRGLRGCAAKKTAAPPACLLPKRQPPSSRRVSLGRT